jgi:hypothetical protein
MNPLDAREFGNATTAFMRTIAEASALTADGITGPELNELIARAGELLDTIDRHIRALDPSTQGKALALAKTMRENLLRLEMSIGPDEPGQAQP